MGQDLITIAKDYTLAYTNVIKKDKLESNILAMRKRIDGMYGVEAGAKSVMTKLIKELEREKNRPQLPYMPFSLLPLTWRTDNGLPKLAVFALNEHEFYLEVERGSSNFKNHMSPYVPGVQDYYNDVFKLLERKLINNSGIRMTKISSSFNSGAIPWEVRQEIEKAKNVFPDRVYTHTNIWSDIFIVAEVQNWDMIDSPVKVDPLVIGHKSDFYWLITSFDLTSLENLALDTANLLAV